MSNQLEKDINSVSNSPDPKMSIQAIHLLRTAQVNTMILSQMADQKASILLGATFLVFSLGIGGAVGAAPSVPLIMLILFAFVSSLLATVAVFPGGGKAPPGITPNPLFFGHFAEQDEAAWAEGLIARFASDEAVYRTMLHDIFQNGQVLQRRKFKYLRLAYSTFIGGMLVTLAAFAVQALNHP